MVTRSSIRYFSVQNLHLIKNVFGGQFCVVLDKGIKCTLWGQSTICRHLLAYSEIKLFILFFLKFIKLFTLIELFTTFLSCLPWIYLSIFPKLHLTQLTSCFGILFFFHVFISLSFFQWLSSLYYTLFSLVVSLEMFQMSSLNYIMLY